MSALRDSLNKLFAFLAEQGQVVPTSKVRIVEVRSDVAIDERGRPRLNRANGFSWINISCCGLDGEHLVVSVETPRETGRSHAQTSINVSGPTRGVLDHDWDVSEALALT